VGKNVGALINAVCAQYSTLHFLVETVFELRALVRAIITYNYCSMIKE
jgi:hypothetical protein